MNVLRNETKTGGLQALSLVTELAEETSSVRFTSRIMDDVANRALKIVLVLACVFSVLTCTKLSAQSPALFGVRSTANESQVSGATNRSGLGSVVADPIRRLRNGLVPNGNLFRRDTETTQPSKTTTINTGVQTAPTKVVYGTESVAPHAFGAENENNFGAPSFVSSSQGCGPSISVLNRTAMCPRCGVDEAGRCCCDNGRWSQRRPMQFDQFGQGEYIGPHRPHHVTRYRLRVDDQVNLVYRLTRDLDPTEYEFNVGDTMLVEGETLADGDSGGSQGGGFERTLVVLPDGSVTLPLIGQVRAAGRTVQELRKEIQDRSKKWYKFALWTVTPLTVDTRLQDLRSAVDARQGSGGQSIQLRVSPDGTIQPPALGSVCVQGLTLDEAKFEIDQRYAQSGFRGIEITPILTERAPTFIYVVGEVNQPGRFELVRPTTVMGAIALAQGWDTGGNLRQIVVFRRADDWRLVATKLDLAGALYGNRPTPADEIFLRDSDIVLVPKRPIQRVDDAIDLIFTQGVNPMIQFGAALGILELNFAQ